MVFEYKTPGVEFFIILNGTVDIYKPYSDENLAREKTEKIRKEKVIPFITNSKVRRSDFPSKVRLTRCTEASRSLENRAAAH